MVTNQPQPVVLVRGYGGMSVEDERRNAYQGFNDGTVYPGKRGENYIYEGMVLRFLKSGWSYRDATNVVGYYSRVVEAAPAGSDDGYPPELTAGDRVILDAGMATRLAAQGDASRTLWVFRYYDLGERSFGLYGRSLVRLIDLIRAVVTQQTGTPPLVNIVAHSMGGLIVREALQITYPQRAAEQGEAEAERAAEQYVNKVVTLGTPHQGIAFQLLREVFPLVPGSEELEQFNPDFQADAGEPRSYRNLGRHFSLDRLLTVVGTDYRSYGVGAATALNRIFSLPGEYGPAYNRSDGLVKQTYAQVPGSYRTFVHKCHGGPDSLVTAREAFEIASRFFFGDFRVRLRLLSANITRGRDLFGRSEFFFGMSVKPRAVDFDLFHQSKEAENCYGPFRRQDLTDTDVAFPWGPDGLIWEGFLDTTQIPADRSPRDLVMRLDLYVGERDTWGIGFSDNVILRRQHYVRARLDDGELFHYPDERFADPAYVDQPADRCRTVDAGWEFDVRDTGFSGTFRIELERVPG